MAASNDIAFKFVGSAGGTGNKKLFLRVFWFRKTYGNVPGSVEDGNIWVDEDGEEEGVSGAEVVEGVAATSGERISRYSTQSSLPR